VRKEKGKIAVLGDLGSIMGYRGLGLEVYPVTVETDVQQELRSLIQSDDYVVIFLTEQFYERCAAVIDEYRHQFLPAIVSIPSAGEQEGLALQSTQEAVRRAVGFDILSNREALESVDEGEKE